jgi:peptidoglycan/xylan/chitin deacetylase (PgdA/CDA1 family)
VYSWKCWLDVDDDTQFGGGKDLTIQVIQLFGVHAPYGTQWLFKGESVIGKKTLELPRGWHRMPMFTKAGDVELGLSGRITGRIRLRVRLVERVPFRDDQLVNPDIANSYTGMGRIKSTLMDAASYLVNPDEVMQVAGTFLGNPSNTQGVFAFSFDSTPPSIYFQREVGHLVAFTIDDAPSRNVDQFFELLRILNREKIKVTFMVIGAHAQMTLRHREALEQAVLNGHCLANHMMHDEAAIEYSQEQFEADLDQCQTIIDQVYENLGKPLPPLLFRAPQGKANAMMRQALRVRGYVVVMGDVYSIDPSIHDAAYHARFAIDNSMPGSIIIMHCPETWHRGAECHRHQILHTMPPLINGIKEKGFSFVTLKDMLPEYLWDHPRQ